MKINIVESLSKAQINKLLSDESLSKSAKIKKLFHAGISIKEISLMLSIRYNFAYNVISNYIITNSIEIIKEEKASKKDEIIKLYLESKSMKEISIELKSNYNYVHKIIKEYKLSLESKAE